MNQLKTNISNLEELLDLANSLPDAITLDELTNPGSAATMLEGTEMLDAEGKKVTGTIDSKDSSDLTASGATVTVPAGYYAEDASKSVDTTTPATPTISVDSSTGKITASVSQSGGYINVVGTKTATSQLDTQEATTITPTKSSQTAVEAGKYTTGAVTIKGDANLVAANIISGKSIFGVAGSAVTAASLTDAATVAF